MREDYSTSEHIDKPLGTPLPKRFDQSELVPLSNLKDHLANENTYLAWIRTCIGIMAFGFVVERFNLFMKHVAVLISKEAAPQPTTTFFLQGYTSFFGVFVVLLGALIALLAFFKYCHIQRQIESGSYAPSTALIIVLTIAVFFIGLFLVMYLTNMI